MIAERIIRFVVMARRFVPLIGTTRAFTGLNFRPARNGRRNRLWGLRSQASAGAADQAEAQQARRPPTTGRG